MKRSLSFILITVFVDTLGYSMMLPLLPFFAQRLGGDAFTAGLMQALYAFLQLFSGPVLGSISDRFGRKPVLIACLAGTALAYTIFGFANALWLLFLAVILDGLTGNNLTTSFTYVADMTANAERARGMGMVSAAFGLGIMAGPALGGLLSGYGLQVPAFAAAAAAFANTLYGIFILPESLPFEKRSTHAPSLNFLAPLGSLFQNPSVRGLMLSLFFVNFAFSGLQTNFPLFSHARLGWDARQNGIFFAFVGMAAVFVQGFLYGRIQPRLGERRASILGLSLLCVGMLATATVSESRQIYFAVAVAAFGSGISIPSLSGLVSNLVSQEQQGRLMGGNQTLIGIAMIAGPLMAGFVFENIAVAAPYFAGSLLALIALLTVLHTYKRMV